MINSLIFPIELHASEESPGGTTDKEQEVVSFGFSNVRLGKRPCQSESESSVKYWGILVCLDGYLNIESHGWIASIVATIVGNNKNSNSIRKISKSIILLLLLLLLMLFSILFWNI